MPIDHARRTIEEWIEDVYRKNKDKWAEELGGGNDPDNPNVVSPYNFPVYSQIIPCYYRYDTTGTWNNNVKGVKFTVGVTDVNKAFTGSTPADPAHSIYENIASLPDSNYRSYFKSFLKDSIHPKNTDLWIKTSGSSDLTPALAVSLQNISMYNGIYISFAFLSASNVKDIIDAWYNNPDPLEDTGKTLLIYTDSIYNPYLQYLAIACKPSANADIDTIYYIQGGDMLLQSVITANGNLHGVYDIFNASTTTKLTDIYTVAYGLSAQNALIQRLYSKIDAYYSAHRTARFSIFFSTINNKNNLSAMYPNATIEEVT